jgi:hypothetical protein
LIANCVVRLWRGASETGMSKGIHDRVACQ